MSATTIEWTEMTWNPTVGCTRVSEGCRNCYAFALHDMRHAAHQDGKRVPLQYATPFKELQLMPDRLVFPLAWRKPRLVFVNSMSDLFHEDVPDKFIDSVFAVMNATAFTLPINERSTRWHTYQILTKRADRMQQYITSRSPRNFPRTGSHPIFAAGRGENGPLRGNGVEVMNAGGILQWPLPNVWLGVSVEDQQRADERIPLLLQTPAAVRFLSCEPLLGPIEFDANTHNLYGGIHWCIVGGESGPGARPMNIAWARSIVEQCKAAGVACFVKQLGACPVYTTYQGKPSVRVELPWTYRCDDPAVGGPKHVTRAGFRDRKGGDQDEWPADLRVREFPATDAPPQ